jgi:hypothetical protein
VRVPREARGSTRTRTGQRALTLWPRGAWACPRGGRGALADPGGGARPPAVAEGVLVGDARTARLQAPDVRALRRTAHGANVLAGRIAQTGVVWWPGASRGRGCEARDIRRDAPDSPAWNGTAGCRRGRCGGASIDRAPSRGSFSLYAARRRRVVPGAEWPFRRDARPRADGGERRVGAIAIAGAGPVGMSPSRSGARAMGRALERGTHGDGEAAQAFAAHAR